MPKNKSDNSKKSVAASTQMPKTVNPQLLLAKAIEKQLPLEQMERLLAMRRELKEEWSREQYYISLSLFQRECPIIKKTKKVDFISKRTGYKTKYNYAPLETIIDQIKELLERYGFSYTWSTQQTADGITAVCHAHHRDGHTTQTSLTVPIDKEAFMSAPQKIASALTYAKRYTLCDAFGIGTGDEDDDAINCNGDNKIPDKKSDQKAKQESNPEPKQPNIKDICYRIHAYGLASCNGDESYFGKWLESYLIEHKMDPRNKMNGMTDKEIIQLWSLIKSDVEEFESTTKGK